MKKETLESFKVLLTGEAGVGKSALVHRFVNGAEGAEAHYGVTPHSKSLRLDGAALRLHVYESVG